MKRASTLLIFGCSLLLGKTPFAGATGLSDQQRASHLLDRLAFGARPGEVEKLSSQGPAGIARWIERQLHPQTIADDAMEAKLAKLPAIRMNAKELLENFRRPEDVALEMGVKKEDFQKDEELKKKVREKIGQEKLPEEINRELAAQRLIRAVESRRELQEVLVDFWMNHFNIDISKGEERWLLPDFESRVIRPRIFGKFSELLKATTRSPAMLFYLDNHLSESPLDYAGKNGPVPKKNGRGLNENYAREILELHTLGVEGGYDQTDVTELARILTGWSIEDPHKSPEFKFKEKIHDRGGKSFLGSRFDPGHGIDEGERAIDLIVSHPSTARLIAFKLCKHFVSDRPPEKLVIRVAKKFTETQGDLLAVYRTLFNSPEFWAKESFRAKVKSPQEFTLSAIRAMGGEIDLKTELPKSLAAMGEEPYRCAPPTGYKDDAETWVNPGAMVSRLDFAVRLAMNHVDGTYVQLPRLGRTPGGTRGLLQQVSTSLLHANLGKTTWEVVQHEFINDQSLLGEGEISPLFLAKASGLILGSPEFQRR